MSETDDLVELPDAGGRPWVLHGDAAERALTMMAADRPDWLRQIIAATVDGGDDAPDGRTETR